MSWNKPPVLTSNDYVRVRNLPVRHDGCYPPDLVAEMTKLLRTPGGAQSLFEVQAKALYDLGNYGKGFFPIAVGRGKTLISFLAPRMLGARNPLLILPAKLIEVTERKWKDAAKDWRIAKHLRFMSYEMLGRVSGATKLDIGKPDMLICDEAHKLKNPGAAVTRRVARYMAANPKTVFVPMSGTIMKSSVKDFAHLLQWSHRETSCLPLHKDALYEWADALDEGLNPVARRSPGVLLELFPVEDDCENDWDPSKRARRVFFSRASATAGVVLADAKDAYAGSLQISAVEYTPNAATEENFKTLRTTMCQPDGWALSDAMQVWRVARQLALGLHYAWIPPPPPEWLQARKSWAQFVRDTLATPQSQREGWDSELQVTNAVLNGHLEDEYNLLGEWRTIKPTFTIDPVPVWHDQTALELCAEWLGSHAKGVCWVEHVFFGRQLAKLTGLPYFGAKGKDPTGAFIEDASGPIIASIAANNEGRNLQFKWCDNLVTCPPADSERWEQVIARMHRYGQTEDTVTVDVLVGCREHLEAIPRALSSSEVKADLLGASHKIRIADLDWPDTHIARQGMRWA